MHVVRGLILGILLAFFLAACVASTEKEKPKVHCPACGYEFDALYQTRFYGLESRNRNQRLLPQNG